MYVGLVHVCEGSVFHVPFTCPQDEDDSEEEDSEEEDESDEDEEEDESDEEESEEETAPPQKKPQVMRLIVILVSSVECVVEMFSV